MNLGKHTATVAILLFLCISLSACFAPQSATQLMPKIALQREKIDFHVAKNVNLIWKMGEVIASDGGHTAPPIAYDLESTLTMMADEWESKHDPAKFSYAYGRSQQVIFMTSLRDNLERFQAFAEVNLTTDESTTDHKQIKMVVDFVKTRVGTEADSFPIYLTVKLTITDNAQSFMRKFFVYATENKSFKLQQTDVSQQLMDDIVKAIREWSHN